VAAMRYGEAWQSRRMKSVAALGVGGRRARCGGPSVEGTGEDGDVKHTKLVTGNTVG
jgi:hypothetical protein